MSDSDVGSMINSDNEMNDSDVEKVEKVEQETVKPKTAKSKKKHNTAKSKKERRVRKVKKAVIHSDSDDEGSDNEVSKARNEVNDDVSDDVSDDVPNDVPNDIPNDVPSNDREKRINMLETEVFELKEQLNKVFPLFFSTNVEKGKLKKSTKVIDKSYKLHELTHWQIKSLVMKESNWGKFEKTGGDNSQNLNKTKLAEDISNEKLRDFVINAIEDDDLLDELDIKLDDGKITTSSVIKLIKNHCKENDGLVQKKITDDNGDIKNKTLYNLMEGDFEDMFEEYVSSH